MAQAVDLKVTCEVELTVIRPGDTALVRVQRGTTSEQAQEMTALLKEQLPGVEVLLLAGVDGIEVYRPDESPASAEGITHYRALDGDSKAVPMCDAPQEGAQVSVDWLLVNCSDCRAG